MEIYLEVLKKNSLFKKFEDNEILAMLSCLNVQVKRYKKEEAIFLAGDEVNHIGMVLSGKVRIQKEDIHGEVVVIDEVNQSEIFGEGFVCAGIAKIPVSVWAKNQTEIMFLEYGKIIKTCPSACLFHTKLIQNMMETIAGKLILLNTKLTIIQRNTIREKLMVYFEYCSEKNGSLEFVLPYSKTALAEYLGVNRSAMSREISAMAEDGLLNYSGSRFILLLV